jgi:hypothetical protein
LGWFIMASSKRVLGGLILLFSALAAAQVQQPQNGGTGTSTAPTAGQIPIGQSTGKYAPKTVSGCTLTSAGALSCSGGGGGALNGVNSQTGSYTAVSGDNGKIISMNCAAPCTFTLPSPISSTWAVFTQATGPAAVSIAPPSGVTIDGVLGTAQMNPTMGVSIWTDGTNYFTNRGAILTTSNTVPALTNNYASAGCTGSGCGASIALPYDVTPGDAIIVEAQHSKGTVQNPFSDAQGDTFVEYNYQSISGEFDLWQFVACNAIGGPTTISMGAGADFSVVAAYEVSGVLASSSCVDKYASAQNSTGSPLSTGSISTTAAYDFIFVSGATRAGAAHTFTEANSYTSILYQNGDANSMSYQSWYGIAPATGSLSDTITITGGGGDLYAGILALLPAGTNSIIPGDLIAAGPAGALQPLHAGANQTVLTSNGPDAIPSYQTPYGTPLEVNGTVVANPNLNGTTPAAAGGGTNCTWQISGSDVSCYIPAAVSHPSVTFNVATGAAASPAAPYLLAPVAGFVSHCYFVTLTADVSTNLVFNVNKNGTSILSGSSATVTAGTSAGTVSTFSLTSSTVPVSQEDEWEFDITTGTSNWTGAMQCY